MTRKYYKEHRNQVLKKMHKYYADHKDLIKARRKKRQKKQAGAYRRWYLEKEYGVSLEEYHAVLKRQKGVCAICHKKQKRFRLAVDHDHKTGDFRGILCRKCNTAIGLLNDDMKLVKQALEYLKTKTGDE